MSERKQKAEGAARAMGWRFNDYGTHTNWTRPCSDGVRRMGDPDLDDWRFVGAMIEWLWVPSVMGGATGRLGSVIVMDWDTGQVEDPSEWGDRLADALIAQAEREAKR